MVLIPKEGGEYHVIGLVEVVWKVAMVILNRRLTNFIAFHDINYLLWVCRSASTASLEAKLIQKLMNTREEVIYEIFLYLKKSYSVL